MALVRLILIGLLFYLILRFIGRLLFPFLYTKQNNSNPQKTQKKAGEVTIDYIEKKGVNKDKNNDEDYIEFEELE